MTNDREIIIDFIVDLNAGIPLPEVHPNVVYIPRRLYSNNYESMYHPFQKFSGGPSARTKGIFNYLGFPEKVGKDFEPSLGDMSRGSTIGQSWLEKILSNVYLYKGYIEHVLLDHLGLFLEGNYKEILAKWKEFCPLADKWSSPFTFNVPLSVKAICPIYGNEIFGTKKKKTKSRHYELYHSEVELLREHLPGITEMNMLYYLLLRECDLNKCLLEMSE